MAEETAEEKRKRILEDERAARKILELEDARKEGPAQGHHGGVSYLDISLDGKKTTRMMRHEDMDDKEWERAKKVVVDNGYFKGGYDAEKDPDTKVGTSGYRSADRSERTDEQQTADYQHSVAKRKSEPGWSDEGGGLYSRKPVVKDGWTDEGGGVSNRKASFEEIAHEEAKSAGKGGTMQSKIMRALESMIGGATPQANLDTSDVDNGYGNSRVDPNPGKGNKSIEAVRRFDVSDVDNGYGTAPQKGDKEAAQKDIESARRLNVDDVDNGYGFKNEHVETPDNADIRAARRLSVADVDNGYGDTRPNEDIEAARRLNVDDVDTGEEFPRDQMKDPDGEKRGGTTQSKILNALEAMVTGGTGLKSDEAFPPGQMQTKAESDKEKEKERVRNRPRSFEAQTTWNKLEDAERDSGQKMEASPGLKFAGEMGRDLANPLGGINALAGPGPGMIGELGRSAYEAVAPGVRSVGNALMPNIVAPNAPAGMPPPQGVAPVGQSETAMFPPPQQGSVGASQSLSVGAKTSGGGAVGSIPNVGNRDAEQQAAVDAQIAAKRNEGEIERAGMEEKGKTAQAQQDQIMQHQKQLQDQSEYVRGQSKKLFDDTMEAQKILQDPAKTPDPERYWKNHSKIMFAIGVGLMTQAKADTSGVLRAVDQAIDRDIEQQKAEFEAPRNAAKARIAGNTNLYGMLRNMGHDAHEATQAAIALSKDFYGAQAKKVAANTGSQMAMAKAESFAADTQGKNAQEMNQLLQHRQVNETNKWKAEQDARQQRNELSFKIGQSKKEGGPKMSPDDEKRHNSAVEGLNTINELRQLRGKPEGYVGGAVESFKAQIPGTNAEGKRTAVKALNFRLATSLSKSSLQKEEQKTWIGEDGKGGLLGTTGLENLNQKELDALEEIFKRDIESSKTGQVATHSGSSAPTFKTGPVR